MLKKSKWKVNQIIEDNRWSWFCKVMKIAKKKAAAKKEKNLFNARKRNCSANSLYTKIRYWY
jgi:hypothetical protein